MPASLQGSPTPLRTVLRPAPGLAPEDSLYRFIQVARFQTAPELPVLRAGRLIGVASLDDVLPVLAILDSDEREVALLLLLETILRPARAVARPEMSLAEVARLCANTGVSLIPVADEDDVCFGIIYATDLLLPELPPPRPSPVGGMATPFGVYLTNGSIQAGVGNLALVASGVYTGLLMVTSYVLVGGALAVAGHFGHFSAGDTIDAILDAKSRHAGFTPFVIRAVAILIFLILMRLTRLTGYHAAEHQTVHAMERNEPLVPEVVARMPRPHPRCGTNVMAAAMIFLGLNQLLTPMVGLDDSLDLLVLSALGTLFTWRPFGTMLQAKFTTRPASDHELRSGIAAGNDLMEKYLNEPPGRTPFLRRLWCMGLLQNAAGMMAVMSLAFWALSFVNVH